MPGKEDVFELEDLDDRDFRDAEPGEVPPNTGGDQNPAAEVAAVGEGVFQPTPEQLELSTKITEKLNSLSDTQKDWYGMLIAVGLDDFRGDLAAAFAQAELAFTEQPNPPE